MFGQKAYFEAIFDMKMPLTSRLNRDYFEKFQEGYPTVFFINYHVLMKYIGQSCSPENNHGPPAIFPYCTRQTFIFHKTFALKITYTTTKLRLSAFQQNYSCTGILCKIARLLLVLLCVVIFRIENIIFRPAKKGYNHSIITARSMAKLTHNFSARQAR